ncbi:MAG TPA: hybrid sensor histidine kinase/response regulator [Vicinamibacterales bacterium]|nr:hybrid sensor histidine kinase/response regulator [Vicinamibacterales bacterium]
MRPTLPLSVQLLLTFVGLLTGITLVLTTTAYTSLFHNLEADARRTVSEATRGREQSLSQLFQLRQQRAETFLVTVQSLCTESVGSATTRRLAWLEECVRPMVDDFRKGEGALSALLTNRTRVLRRSGLRIVPMEPSPGTLARAIRTDDSDVRYAMQARRQDLTLRLMFDHTQVERIFGAGSGLPPWSDLSLIDYDGQVLASAGRPTPSSATQPNATFLDNCRGGADAIVDADNQGQRAFQSFRPVAVLGTACVAARLDYDQTLAPAEQLRRQLFISGAWFVLAGVVLSLVAAQWIAAPVRRLALSARTLQTGRFDRPIPLSGPSEVRALSRAFNAMGNDLAELVAKEQAARREAEAANRSKDEFLATVSHELRTPLTAIVGWAHMLRTERLPPDGARHAIAVIERSALAQRHLIEDLLDVSRIVSNRLHISREPLPFAEVVEAAVDTVRPQARAQQIEIDMTLDRSPIVLGDARRLEQVVWNLAWNAVKFTHPSGRISIKLEHTNKQAILTVADTGVGISSKFLPHVFDWFRQADGRSRSQSGLGLGLGIARHIVRLHGGSVRADSRGEGKGATFVVTLPIHVADSPTISQPTSPIVGQPLITSLKNVRVLLVEDDDDTRELVRMTLEEAGASVEAVASAEEARREMMEEAPDILISDIRMPEENGYSLIQSLRAAGVSTPAIALTALARREDADAAQAAGFQLHIAKPIDVAGLVDAVARLVHTVH